MKKAFRRLVSLAVAVATIGAFAVQASAYDAYVYSYEGEYQKSLPIYEPTAVIDLSAELSISLSGTQDIYYSDDGDLYVADTDNDRVLVYDTDYHFLRAIYSFIGADGEEDFFSAPAGLYVDSQKNLYVADSLNGRIVELNAADECVRIVDAPVGTGITEEFVYKPISVTADPNGRLYVVSESSNMGVLSFDMNGNFEGFLGVQNVTYSATELFWRIFMTEEQRERTVENIPADFNSIEIDEDGFLYVVSASLDKSSQYSALVNRSTSSDYAPIKLLNPSGTDILSRNGFYPPAGDIDIDKTVSSYGDVSGFTDITANELGIYTVLDHTHNRLFTYSSDGDLLCAFGGSGSAAGYFQDLTAIAYNGTTLAAFDVDTGCLTVFTPSQYGATMFEALTLEKDRQYDAALAKWQELLPLNNNLDVVYMDMGKAYLRSGRYDEAMEYFEMIGETEYYSKAFSKKGADYMGWTLLITIVAVIAFFAVVSWALRKVKAANAADDVNPPAKITVGKQLQYAFYPIFHPFDGFYVLNRQKRGGMAGSLIIMGVSALVYLINRYLSGYLFSATMSSDTNLLIDAITFLLPFLIFAVANYCVTTLFDGEGSFKAIFQTVCYSMLPLILILLPATVVANFLSLDESVILTLLTTLAYGWTIGLIFCGMTTIHGYSFTRSLVATILSLFGMIVIVFLLMLFASLTIKLTTFIGNVATELSYRF